MFRRLLIPSLVTACAAFCFAAAPVHGAEGDATPTVDPPRGDNVNVEVLPQPIKQVPPIYPEKARKAEIFGTVQMKALISRDGLVKDLYVTESIPELDAAAMKAVRQWVFQPATTNGKPASVWIIVPIRFNLTGATRPEKKARPVPLEKAPPPKAPPGKSTTSKVTECDSLDALIRTLDVLDASPTGLIPRSSDQLCLLEYMAPSDAAHALGQKFAQALRGRGWTEVPEKSAEKSGGTRFALRRGGLVVEAAGRWDDNPHDDVHTPGSQWSLLVRPEGANPSTAKATLALAPPTEPETLHVARDEKPIDFKAFNARLAAARDSAWARAPATIGIAFVGGAECQCARFDVLVVSAPERFDDASVVVTRDGLLDDSIQSDRHRLTLRKGQNGRWQIESALQSWRCAGGRGQADYAAAPCK